MNMNSPNQIFMLLNIISTLKHSKYLVILQYLDSKYHGKVFTNTAHPYIYEVSRLDERFQSLACSHTPFVYESCAVAMHYSSAV